MSKFYGSSIISFSESASVGGEVALDVTLVDCGLDGDSFSPPTEGTPSLFEYDGHEFFGLLDRYTRSESSSAYPEYSVQLSNGMFLLAGTQLILNDYYGITNSVPNLVNVFGFLEDSGGFGGAGINDAGISWLPVAQTLNALINYSGSTPYGAHIKHKGFKYGLDISQLPNIPSYYRINSTSISILEFIEEVCEAGGHDFFVKLLEGTSGLDGIFKVITVSRLEEPSGGAIQAFVDSAQCVTSRELGRELRKDATSKMVVGANVENIWLVEPPAFASTGDITGADYVTYNVLPYFGQDIDYNYIVGETFAEEPDEYYFDIDIRDINHPELGPTYRTCLAELRAAKMGRENWDRFLAERSCNKYMILNDMACEGEEITARPFVLAVPSGNDYVKSNYEMADDGEYAPSGNYAFLGIPKYGSVAFNNAYRSNGIPKPNPNNQSLDYPYHFYILSNDISSYTATTCAINSEKQTIFAEEKLLPFLYYPSSDRLNPYFMRSTLIRNVSGPAVPLARLYESDLYWLASDTVAAGADAVYEPFFQETYEKFKGSIGTDQFAQQAADLYNTNLTNRARFADGFFQERSNNLYKKIKSLADNYYGKRFIVTIPNMYGAVEPESTKIRLSQVPTEAGYLDQTLWDVAYASGYIPDNSGINKLLSPEEKFYPYIKLENAISYSGVEPYGSPYDYSEISESERTFGSPWVSGLVLPWGTANITYYDLWVKCSVSPEIVYYDSSTMFGPRAIVELPGQITWDPLGNYGSLQALYTNLVGIGKSEVGAFGADTSFDNTAMSKVLNSPGIDEIRFHEMKLPVMPNLFAVPLKSNLLTYGPWYLAGAEGPVIYEKNDDLAPWNYGGYTNLDLAGFGRVTDGVTNQTFNETGSVSVVGAPTVGIADQLISGGPYVTDLSVSFGPDGITTQYSFQTWSSQRRLSKLTNFQGERIKRLNEVSRSLRRTFREGVGNNLWTNPAQFFSDIRGKFVNLEDYARRDNSNTSHKIIMGNAQNVVSQPVYNTVSQVEGDYENNGAMSLDGIFRPYSLWPHDKLPSFTMPVNSGETGTSLDLNPLKLGHDITILVSSSGGEITAAGLDGSNPDVEIDESGVPDYRGIALKGPLVIAGWGRDVVGDPVPLYVDDEDDPVLDDSGNKQWALDYLRNPASWPTGPLDVRWDQDRGVWAAGDGGGEFISFVIDSPSESIGDTSAGCNYVLTTVTDIGHKTRSVEIGATGIKVFDDDLCHFNLPISVLIGLKGKAIAYKNIYSDDVPSTGNCITSDIVNSSFRWVVTGLCCGEEIIDG
jgi:hypothetical protein